MDEKKEEPLSKIFDIEEDVEENVEEKQLVLLPETVNENRFDEYVDADYEFARENIMSTILKAQDALDSMIDLAQVAQHPRAYEVVGGLVNTIVASNKDLLDLAKKNKELKKVEAETPASQTSNVTQNNMFVGSTTEFLKMLKDNGIKSDVKEIILQQSVKKKEIDNG